MLYRITLEKFLTHMVDYFKLEEIAGIEYAIISSKISNSGKCQNIVKLNELYPSYDIISEYAENNNMDTFKKMYVDYLRGNMKDKLSDYEISSVTSVIYRALIQPFENHNDICLLCTEAENYYMDILCDFLKDEYSAEVIDLNILFTKGKIGPISIDRDDIHDKMVDIRRAALREYKRNLEATHDGRVKLISLMSKKEKLKKLKELGVSVSNKDKDLDQLLIEAYEEK